VNSSEVFMGAAVMSKADFDKVFGQLPALPMMAFQDLIAAE